MIFLCSFLLSPSLFFALFSFSIFLFCSRLTLRRFYSFLFPSRARVASTYKNINTKTFSFPFKTKLNSLSRRLCTRYRFILWCTPSSPCRSSNTSLYSRLEYFYFPSFYFFPVTYQRDNIYHTRYDGSKTWRDIFSLFFFFNLLRIQRCQVTLMS